MRSNKEIGAVIETMRQWQAALDFVRANCPILYNLTSPIDDRAPKERIKRWKSKTEYYHEKPGTLAANILWYIIDNDINKIEVNGPPTAGKSDLIKEFTALFSFMDVEQQPDSYDEALQTSYKVFDDLDDEAWSQNKWTFLSAWLLLKASNEVSFDDLPDPQSDPKAFYDILVSFLTINSEPDTVKSLLSFFATNSAAFFEDTPHKVLIEAPAVAVVKGKNASGRVLKDRGRLSSKVLARREVEIQNLKRSQRGSGKDGVYTPRTMKIVLIGDPRTRDFAIAERSIAKRMDGLIQKGAQLEELMPYIQQLEKMGVKLSENSILSFDEVKKWVYELVISADEKFVLQYREEQEQEALEWLKGFEELRRTQVNEVSLPVSMEDLDADEQWFIMLYCAFMLDLQFTFGLAEHQFVVGINAYIDPSDGNKKSGKAD